MGVELIKSQVYLMAVVSCATRWRALVNTKGLK